MSGRAYIVIEELLEFGLGFASSTVVDEEEAHGYGQRREDEVIVYVLRSPFGQEFLPKGIHRVRRHGANDFRRIFTKVL